MNTTSDNGGVHINSGIPNRAIHLTATEIGGNAWEKAGYISYITLTERLRENSNFQEAALMTSEVASSIYGQGAREQKAVQMHGPWLVKQLSKLTEYPCHHRNIRDNYC